MNRLRLLFGFCVAAFVAIVLIGCSSDGPDGDAGTVTEAGPTLEAGSTAAVSSTTVTPGMEASPRPTSSGEPVQPDGERILEDVKLFSDTIGPRPAGSTIEKGAADLIAERLRGLGFEVTLQEFSIGRQIARTSTLSVLTPTASTIATLPFENTATASASGRLVSAGIGRPEEFPADTEGAIALIERGTLLFNDKVSNAEAAGAVGVVIFNNEPDVFYGSLSGNASIPAVAISQEAGEDLRSEIGAAEVTVELSVGELGDEISYNVVAEPPDRECETVTGGHYDSVLQAPGASDNASGTATVLEIAAILSQNGSMAANCFVLFGAEEIGLVGSEFYVSSLNDEQRNSIKAMLNFDMVGVGEEAWWFIGTPELQQRMVALAEDLGIEDGTPSTLIRGLSSDHANFLNAGVPALMFHRWEDNLLHTPQDVSDRVDPELLEEAALMGVAMLESLSAGS